MREAVDEIEKRERSLARMSFERTKAAELIRGGEVRLEAAGA